MSSTDYTEFSVTLLHKTVKAVLLDFETAEVWVPLSVLSDDGREAVDDAEVDDVIDVEIATWFADKEGLNE